MSTTYTDDETAIRATEGVPDIGDGTVIVQMGSDPEQSDIFVRCGGKEWFFKAFSLDDGIVFDVRDVDDIGEPSITITQGGDRATFFNESALIVGGKMAEKNGVPPRIFHGNPAPTSVCVSYDTIDFLIGNDGKATIYKHDEDKKRINLLGTTARYGGWYAKWEVFFGKAFHFVQTINENDE